MSQSQFKSQSQASAASAFDADIIARRRRAVADTVAKVRRIEKEHGVTRHALKEIEAELINLTKQKDLFDQNHFPNPEPGASAKLYVLSEDDDHRFPIYLTCALPGGAVRPHNHGTWAVVAGLDGCEENHLYDRVEGGDEPGPAKIELREKVQLRDGESIALMPDDIHSVATPGDIPRRHFHMYGLSLEHLPKRLAYDTADNICAYMEINPKVVRVDHA